MKDSYPRYATKVLNRLGIDKKSAIGDLLTPGINGERHYRNRSIEGAVEAMRPHAERFLRECPEKCSK